MDKQEVIQEKSDLISQLNEANMELLRATIEYKKVKNTLWLNTDFEEVMGKKRPTVDEKKAYVSQHSIKHREVKEVAEYNCEFIKNMIELCSDKLSIL